jgi:hypothetical protein
MQNNKYNFNNLYLDLDDYSDIDLDLDLDLDEIEFIRNEYIITNKKINKISNKIKKYNNKIHNKTLLLHSLIKFDKFDNINTKDSYINQENHIIEIIYKITTIKIRLLEIHNEFQKLVSKNYIISGKYGNSLFE